MEGLPKISIITPSYGQASYIEETILSVIGQEYPNLEYIIIDGGSTDGSVEIIEKYKEHLAYWVSEPDKGQTDAINKGLHKATGDIVAWLNSDDVYAPGTLLAIGEAFAANPDVSIFYGDVENFFPDGSRAVSVNDFELTDFLARVSIHQPGVFWRRALHNDLGYLDESFYYLMDYDLWARFFFNSKHQHIDRVMTWFRVHDEAKTGNNPPGLYMDYRRVLSRFWNSLPDTKYKNKAIELGVYANPENVVYPLSKLPSHQVLEQVFDRYVFNCIEQEYTFGHWANTNKLVLKTLGSDRVIPKLQFFVKNNLGIGMLKSKGGAS